MTFRPKTKSLLLIGLGAGLNFLLTGVLWPEEAGRFLQAGIIGYLIITTLAAVLGAISEARRKEKDLWGAIKNQVEHD